MKSGTGASLWLQDIRKSEYILGILKTTAVFGVIVYVFYGSFAAAPLLIPVWFLYMRDWITDTVKKKEQQFREQFRDSIQQMAAALKAGYSVENAIREVSRELVPMYDKDTRIRREYDRMAHQLDMKIPAVSVLEAFCRENRTGGCRRLCECICSCKEKRRRQYYDHPKCSQNHQRENRYREGDSDNDGIEKNWNLKSCVQFLF